MGRLLIIEDDVTIAALLADHLARAGHEVLTVADGDRGLAWARTERPDLVVLDVMIPGPDGFEVCAGIRATPMSQPVVMMLTARLDEADAIMAFEAGADDYVRKPFGVGELLRRVAALLELSRRQPASALVLGRDALRIERASRACTVHEREVRLTPKEFDLLVYLAERPGIVLGREPLLVAVWGYRHGGYARTVDSHITRIRRKLLESGLSHDPIATVHGVGYRFDGDESP